MAQASEFTSVIFNKQILKFIIVLNLTFWAVEHADFQKLIWICCAEVRISDHTKIAALLKCWVNKVHKSVLTELKSQTKISIALDEWISFNHLIFLEITAYFINKDWNYQEVLLTFKDLKGIHSDENMTEYVIEILKKWNIAEQLLVVTSDNAFNNNTLWWHLSRLLAQKEISWDHKTDIMNCMMYVIQLIVRELLTGLKADIKNNELTTTFDDDEIEHLKIDRDLSFENTLKKICHQTYNTIL